MMLSLLFCPVTAGVSYTSITQCMLDRLKFVHTEPTKNALCFL